MLTSPIGSARIQLYRYNIIDMGAGCYFSRKYGAELKIPFGDS